MISTIKRYLSIGLAIAAGVLALVAKGQSNKLDKAKADAAQLKKDVQTAKAVRKLERAIDKAAAQAEAENKQAREQRNEEAANHSRPTRFGSADRLRD